MPLNIVMFELAKAQGYIASKDWKGLENYVSTFLIEVQGDKFHPHPGIICSISQARISYLIEREQFDEAIAVFNDIVRPLTDQEDDLFKPLDLKTRVDMLERCVEHRLLPPTQLKENLDRAIGDYVTLYFPSSVRDVPTKRTIQDFICTFNAGTECRCLVCGSPLPKEDSAHDIIYHINHEKREQPCPRATRWLREQLAKIKGTTGHASKKRRVLEGPPQVSGSAADEDQECIAIPAGPAYECLGRLVCANMKAYSALSFCKSKSAKRASEIVEQQEMVLDTVRYKVAQAMKDNLLLDAEMLSKVKVVYDLQFSMFPLLNSLGSAYTTMLDLHDKICDMMRHCMQASALHGQSNPFSPLPCAATNTEQTAALSASGSNGSRPTAEQTPAFSDSWSST